MVANTPCPTTCNPALTTCEVSPDALSAEIRLEALELHIQEALKREGLPRLHRHQFQRHLRHVQEARQRMGVAPV